MNSKVHIKESKREHQWKKCSGERISVQKNQENGLLKNKEKKKKKRNVFVRQKESHYHLLSECCLNDTLLVGLCVKFSVCALVPVCLLWYASFHFIFGLRFIPIDFLFPSYSFSWIVFGMHALSFQHFMGFDSCGANSTHQIWENECNLELKS